MATIEQFTELNRFVETLSEEEFRTLSVDEIYARWRDEAIRQEDITAIQEAITDYENGDRGQLAEEFLADFRAEKSAAKKP